MADRAPTEQRCIFWTLYFISTFFGIFMVLSISDWAILYKRDGQNTSEDLLIIEITKSELSYPAFGYHPLLMSLGMIFLLGQSSVIFVVFSDQPVARTKLYHMTFMSVILLLAFLGLYAVFAVSDEHFVNPHEWVGMAAVILFSLQFLMGFLIKLYPGGTREVVLAYKGFHNFFGILVFMFATAAAVSGISRVSDTKWSAHTGIGRMYVACLLPYVSCTLALIAFRNFHFPKRRVDAAAAAVNVGAVSPEMNTAALKQPEITQETDAAVLKEQSD